MKKIIWIGFLMIAANVIAEEKTPVMVGGNDDLDACMTLGAIVSAKKPEEKIAVYLSPSHDSAILEKVFSGTLAMVCDGSMNGWVGVVYTGNDSPYCGLTTSIEPRQPYEGECKSGWVKESNIKIIAG